MPSQLYRLIPLTLRWIEVVDYERAIAAKAELVMYLEGAGKSRQVDHWLGYSSETTALEGEILAAVIEVEAIMRRMQGLIL